MPITDYQPKNQHETYQLLLDFFKVMGNEHRVSIAGMLITRPQTVSELAQALSLRQSVVLEHLAALREFNLVTAESENQRTIYAFNPQTLYTINHTLLSRANLVTPVDEIADEQTRKILRHFFNGNQLVMIPENKRKFQMLIEWLVTKFEKGVRYTEHQVNEVIERYNEDYATLRRAMIDAGLMVRERGIYWRTESETA